MAGAEDGGGGDGGHRVRREEDGGSCRARRGWFFRWSRMSRDGRAGARAGRGGGARRREGDGRSVARRSIGVGTRSARSRGSREATRRARRERNPSHRRSSRGVAISGEDRRVGPQPAGSRAGKTRAPAPCSTSGETDRSSGMSGRTYLACVDMPRPRLPARASASSETGSIELVKTWRLVGHTEIAKASGADKGALSKTAKT